jgi:hypothetical protein
LAPHYASFSPAAIGMIRLLLVFVAGEISGKIVGRFNGTYHKTVVLSYAVSVVLVSSWLFVDVSLRDINVNDNFAWPILAAALVMLFSVLHGGRLLVRSSEPA